MGKHLRGWRISWEAEKFPREISPSKIRRANAGVASCFGICTCALRREQLIPGMDLEIKT
jgi:hypothetical protein